MKKLLLLILPLILFLSACKKDYDVSRSIIIAAPVEVVWQEVKYFKNWEKWSPWYAKDSLMELTYMGEDGNIESSYSWKSEELGSGEIKNVGMTENEEFLYHTHFLEPWESESDGYITLKQVEGGTEVTWGFKGVIKGISSLFINLDKMVGPDFEAGLASLKLVAEEMASKEVPLEVKTFMFPGQDYLAIRSQIDITSMEAFYAENFALLLETGLATKESHPTNLYYTWDMENMKTDMAIALPVAKGIVAPEGMSIISLPPSKSIYVDFYGPYEETAKAHETMEVFMVENNLTFVGPAIEEYIVGPEEEKDPAKWFTKVIYILK